MGKMSVDQVVMIRMIEEGRENGESEYIFCVVITTMMRRRKRMIETMRKKRV